jgi:hypothetical protein
VIEAIAFAEVTRKPLFIISLDFKEAFDRISHKYLFAILHSYGFSDTFVESIQHLYDNVTSMAQVKGHMSFPFPIHCSVRQGCPLSIMLFALCINPLIHRLEQQSRGIRVNRPQRKTAVVAYAVITIFATESEEIKAIGKGLRSYGKAAGMMLNIAKSQALAVGTWGTTRSVLDIQYSAEI